MITGKDIVLYFSLKYSGNWDKIYEAIRKKETFDYESYIKLKSFLKSQYLTILDDNYPKIFHHIHKPPFVIYYYGNIELLNSSNKLTVVGSRLCSNYGKEMTTQIIEELIKEGIVIVSGMAKGIDYYAHKASLIKDNSTIAVLGSGIDLCYPKQNKDIYEIIKSKHLVISEYPNETIPQKEYFPHRNRLLAALGDAIFVPEAKLCSGTSITINIALNLGKDIFCLPHPINSDNANNRLIRDGAILVEKSSDILEELK